MRTSTGAVMLSRSVSGLPCSGWVGKGPWLCWQSSAQEKAIAAHCGVRSCLPGKSQARHNVAARSEAHGTRRAPYAPSTPPVTQRDIERLVRFFVEHRNVLVIAGAGCSTESDIPDYRGPAGAYTNDGYKPMTHQKFMLHEYNRSRYWARSFAGWMDYSQKEPNGSHIGLHRLRTRNWVSNIITQNVDRTRCTTCQWATSRMHVQQMLNELNPGAEDMFRALESSTDIALTLHGAPGKGGVRQRPDGDVELPGSGHGFRVPDCPQCGGILKPDVVYFGDNVPKHKALWAAKMSQECDALLILGTSCTTLSVFRLVRAVHERGGEVAAVNVGPTRADPLLSFSVAARVGEVLMRLATHDVLLLERPAC